MTIAEFVEKHSLKLYPTTSPVNPHMNDPKWEADHWFCRLHMPNGKMVLFYSMGIGHRKLDPRYAHDPRNKNVDRNSVWFKEHCIAPPPTVEDVLESIVMDADTLDSDFEDWCDNIGLDPDSRKAFKTWEICREQAKELQHGLGRDAFNELREIEF